MTPKAPLLVVEDSEDDLEALSRTLRELRFPNPIKRCADAECALDYLHHRGKHPDPNIDPLPAIILLDLNLPGMDGRELLQALKADAELRRIPVIVYTTSTNPRDVEFCYQHNANAYHVKPMDLDELSTQIRALVEYWFKTALLDAPGGGAG